MQREEQADQIFQKEINLCNALLQKEKLNKRNEESDCLLLSK